MKKLLSLLAIIAGLALISSCAKDEENLSGTISGIVTEYASQNTPIAGATVTLNGKGLSKTTGSDGRFEFTGIEPGTYTIAVKANNYQANTKQVTVYAGQKANCDIQLEVERVSVDISPLNLVFDKTADLLSFTITNQSNRDLTYNLASYMPELEVSPIMGSVKAKGQQTVSVRVTNRSSVKKTTSGQILVNVGSDSYQVNVTINGTEEHASTGGVAGTISDYANANAPIAGATVTLTSTGEAKTTGSDGRYEFEGLTPGTYTITVSANDYEGGRKDVNIEAGKTSTCDFQLQRGAANVEVTPQSLTYAKDVDQLSFTIKNSSSSTQQYTVSGVPDFASVSSSMGMVASKGSEVITVSILNRKQITERKSAQLKVTVGNNAFAVNITVEPYQQEAVSVDITPQALHFDRATEQLTFTMTSKNSRKLDYEISTDLSLLTVTPTSGTLQEHGQQTITVQVKDRQMVGNNQVGQLTINIEGNTFVVTVSVDKYEKDEPEPEPTPGDDPQDKENVTRGLVMYYHFNNNNADDATGNYHGFENGGTYITDTPSGTGKALFLKQKQYISIAFAPLDGRTNYSVSLWVKDFGAGALIRTPYSTRYEKAPSLMVNEDLTLSFCTGNSNYSGQTYTYAANMSSYQSGQWVMLTIVCEPSGTSKTTTTLYVNGRRADAGTASRTDAGGATSMTIGGSYGSSLWSTPMKIDNVRLYSVTLTDEEVNQLYQYEKQ